MNACECKSVRVRVRVRVRVFFLCHNKPSYVLGTNRHNKSMRKIATQCLRLVYWCLIDINRELVEYCEQAESMQGYLF